MREVTYEQRDVPERGGIEIRYRNSSHKKICLGPESWPNPIGAISDADKTAFLVVGERRFPMQLFNGGYCISKCGTEVDPGKEVATLIPYEFFNLPSDLAHDSPKHLEFRTTAYPCR